MSHNYANSGWAWPSCSLSSFRRPAVDGRRDPPRSAADAGNAWSTASGDSRCTPAPTSRPAARSGSRIGGQQLGSIWGHGALRRAGLERRLAASRSRWPARPARAARLRRSTYASSDRRRAGRRCRRACSRLMRANTYDAATGTLTVSDDRAAGHRQRRRALREPVRQRSGDAGAARSLCDEGRHGRRSPSIAAQLTAFFWWTSWAAVTAAPRARRSPTPTTGRTSRWSATRRTPSTVPVDGVQRAVPDRRHRPAGLALRGVPRQGQAR